MSQRFAALFPGQGAYYAGVLSELRGVYPPICEVFSEVDEAARLLLGSSVSEVIFAARKPDIQDMLSNHGDLLQLALYGIAVAGYRVLEARGFQPDVMLGHSFGEIAALVCAGAFSVRLGAEIVIHRTAALKELGQVSGSMIALNTDLEHANHLVSILRNECTVVSVENHNKQVVISGPVPQVTILQELSKAIKLQATVLDSPYPFHNPLLQPAVNRFYHFMRPIQQQQAPLGTQVFSPILGRYYTNDDELTKCLAEHFIQPVHFPAAIRHLYADGIRAFVECGAKDTLCKLVGNILHKESGYRLIACMVPGTGEQECMRQAIHSIEELGGFQSLDNYQYEERLLELFWTNRGPAIRSYIQEELKRFVREQADLQQGQIPHPDKKQEIASNADAGATVKEQPSTPTVNRDDLLRELIALYASELEYPEEVFEEHVALEAELGVDSVKQTELMARVSSKYQLPPRSPDFRLSEYQTLGSIVDFVAAALTAGASGSAVEAPSAISGTSAGKEITADKPDRDQIFRELVAFYAAALEYPEEVFTEDVALEAELGVDSVKQTELMARLSERYELPPRPLNFRLSDYPTLGKIADFVFAEQGKEAVMV